MARGTSNLRQGPSEREAESESRPEIPQSSARECEFGVCESRPIKVWTCGESAECFWILVAAQNAPERDETGVARRHEN